MKNQCISPKFCRLWVFLSIAVGLACVSNAQTALTTLEYKIAGTQLRATPSILSVPKGVAGSILVELISGGTTNQLATAGLGDNS